jgi:chondroitin 4-sulfotransferase 11
MNSYWNNLYINAKKMWQTRMPQGIVCHPYKFIYFPVPKVACSSMKILIAQLCKLEQKSCPHIIDFELVSARHLKSYPDYCCFTVVRNPWDRLVSCYKDKIHHFSETNNGRLFLGFERYNQIFHVKAFYPKMPFDQFVKIVSLIPDGISDEHFRSQTRLIYTPKRSLTVIKVAKLENLNLDLANFLTTLNISNIEIARINQTSPSQYRDYHDTRLKKIVARRYLSDIEMFKYSF